VLYLRQSPGPPLDQFVECFWMLTGAQTARKERILPSGTTELVVNLRENEMRIYDSARPERCQRFRGAILSGAYSRPFVCDATQHESIVGVHFRPGGALPFLNEAASALANTHVDLADLWGRSAGELREQLCEAATSQGRFRIVERFLTDRLDRHRSKRHPALAAALSLFGPAGTGASVRDVTRAIGLCERHFIQIFRSEVGVTPKRFCRLLRFQRARALAQQIAMDARQRERDAPAARTVDWPQLASACGYFDQSHLINDFQEFSGSSPSEYFRRTQEGPWLKDSHVPLAG
jgi:AraC-like DNA-binding protein